MCSFLIAAEICSGPKKGGTRVGVTPRSTGQSGFVCVESVAKDSWFANTALRPGMQVMFIDNKLCRDVHAGQRLLQEQSVSAASKMGVGKTLVIVKNKHNLALATVVKPTRDASVGLGLGETAATHRLVITSLKGLLAAQASSCLKKDMTVLKINNVLCKGLPPAQVASIISQTEGPLTVLADEDPEADAENLVVAAVVKPTINSKVGLGMTQDPSTKIIRITSLDGLFSKTPLRVGMRLLKINDKDCGGMTSGEMLTVIEHVSGTVTVLAERQSQDSSDLAESGLAGYNPINVQQQPQQQQQQRPQPAAPGRSTAPHLPAERPLNELGYIQRSKQDQGEYELSVIDI